MRIFPAALRQARREWRSGAVRSLGAALVIACAALTAVAAFADRIEAGLTQSANELLGGDLVVASRFELEPAWDDEATRRGLSVTRSIEFPTVTFAGDRSLLVDIKAIDPGYPLRGYVEVARVPGGPTEKLAGPLPPETAWVDARVLGQLGISTGDTIEVGDVPLNVVGIVVVEPDRAGFFDLAPRVMVNRSDIENAGLLGEGSRARYRMLVAGESGPVDDFKDWLEPRRGDAYFQTLEDSQQQLTNALDRAQRFLRLAALSAILLAGAAIVVAARQFARSHYDHVAILRCMGASHREILGSIVLALLFLSLPAMLLGVALGYGAQELLIIAMGDLVPEQLPVPGLGAGLAGLVTGALALLGFAVPPLLVLRRIPPARVLKDNLGPAGRDLITWIVPGVFSIALIYWQARDWLLGSWIAGALVVATLVFGFAGLMLVQALSRSRSAGGVGWRYGLAAVARHKSINLLQISGLAMGAMMVLLLSVIQTDLLKSWQTSLPAYAPNFFFINIQPDQRVLVDGLLTENDGAAVMVKSQGVFPMAVGKVTGLNGEPPDTSTRRGERLSRRTVNFTWSESLPRGSTVVEGQWWASPDVAEVSLEEGWAESAGVGIGDTMALTVADTEIEVTVSNLRTVDWDSFEVNFFILVSPGAANDLPAGFVASAFVPDDGFAVVEQLVREAPNVTVIDVGRIVDRVRGIIDRVSLTVRTVFLFTLAAGVVVLVSALRAGLPARLFEAAVLRALGAHRKQLRSALLTEFFIIGAVSGGLAAGAAQLLGWGLARQVFEVDYVANPWLIPAVMVVSGILIAITGYLSARKVMSSSPMLALR